MNQLLLAAAMAAFSFPAAAVTASWTGNSERVQTITFKWVIKCEYNFYMQTFWKLFDAQSCPRTIEVE